MQGKATWLSIIGITLFAQNARSQNLEGSYTLYEEGRPKVVGTMTVTGQSDSSFSVQGAGWTGSGQVSGGRGSYQWRFNDGSSGRTDFSVDADGRLHGHVMGKGIDWKYVAQRMPSSPSPVAADAALAVKSAIARTQRYLSTTRSSSGLFDSALFLFDPGVMARAALGTDSKLGPEQRARFDKAFSASLARAFITVAENASRQTITFTTESLKDGRALVKIHRPAPTSIDEDKWANFTMLASRDDARNHRGVMEWKAVEFTPFSYDPAKPGFVASIRARLATATAAEVDAILAKMEEEANTDGEAIARLAQVQSAITAESQVSEFEVTTTPTKAEPWQTSAGRVAKFTLWEKGEQRLLEFTAGDGIVGTTFLQLRADQIYVYLPAFGKVRRMRLDWAVAQEFSIVDWTTQYYDRFEPALRYLPPRERLLLTRRKAETSPYATIEIDVETARSLPTELRYFDAAGTLLKTETRSQYQCRPKVCAAMELKFVSDAATTVMKRTSWKVDEPIPADTFSKQRLMEKAAQP